MANRGAPRRRPGCHALLARAAVGAIAIVAMTCTAGAAPAMDCASEAAALIQEEAELPRLEVASPADRPPYCITLETIMAFAIRVKAHAVRCPQPDHAPAVAQWDKTRAGYSKLFGQHRCKRTR
jgi:hypothetical protein